MITFLKAQTSSFIASAADFLITLVTVKFFGWYYLPGSISGTVSGGVLNFYINRNWVFDAKSKNYGLQVLKYLLVWTGNLMLVTTGVYLLTHLFNFNYLLSKIASSVLIGITYNYIMQKQFIFSVK
ncbi:GtrA family protein [Pedobacter rhodius]|uniref:GtrA family protein n=1 Tax=Pedobacter rhodius TaxID=3004098 RepID=A0ABT4KVI6_9SPHI|nr:GtrA family protein [Pedobacter sp. SJ11]MCZ4222936.1 GtrA family protein [Pedobacter sp. SJ11]